MVHFDSAATKLEQTSDAEELDGKIGISGNEALMHSVMENDKQTIEDGKLIADAFNRGIGAFTPDMLFEQMVKNYTMTKQLFGDTILRLVSGFDPNYIERNLPIPEFRKELMFNIRKRIDQLKDRKLLDDDGVISDTGVELASVTLYIEELDHLVAKGLGERTAKKIAHSGERTEAHVYRKGDRYRDLNVRKTIRAAIKRQHATLEKEDFRIDSRQSKGTIYLLYGIDASSSMKGAKIETCKKAGIALAYQAIQKKDKVGLVVFGSEVKNFIEPTDNFPLLLRTLTTIRASRETDFTALVHKAIELFPSINATKHLIILTDAMPTVGENPEEETLAAVGQARAAGITLSIIGIQLNAQGEKLAKEMARIGEGRLYSVKSLENIDRLVLEDYDQLNA